MSHERIARWTSTRVQRAINPTIRHALRAGRKGTGHVLWRCEAWDNPRAMEEADRLCAAAEARLAQEGWTILPEDIPTVDRTEEPLRPCASLGARLLAARQAAGLSQQEASRASGVAQPTLSRLEGGHTTQRQPIPGSGVKLGTLHKLARLYGVTVGTLVDGLTEERADG